MSSENAGQVAPRSIHVVLDEYLAARAEANRFAKLRDELLALIGVAHDHDPSRCMECRARLQQNAYGGGGLP